MSRDFLQSAVKSLVAVFVLCQVMFSIEVLAQEATTTVTSAPGDDSTYSIQLEIELLENERNTEESAYSNVYQKKNQKKGVADIDFYIFHLDGAYKEYNSLVKVDAGESKIDEIRDNLAVWVELFEYFYVFGQSKNLMFQYEYLSNSSSQFHELEKARALTQGVGFRFGDWRFGIAPFSKFLWTFDVDVTGISSVSESIEFDLNVFEIVKKVAVKEGPYFELGLKQWTSKDVLDGRDGSLENLDGFLVIGLGLSEDSVLFVGEKISRGKIESTLESDKSKITRVSDRNNFIFGFEFGLTEDSVIYIEKQLQFGKIELDNTSFSSQKNTFEDSVSIGIRFNESLALELNMAKTILEEIYTESAILNQTASFKQTDNLLGISIELKFFD
jgi:hypothetical protein